MVTEDKLSDLRLEPEIPELDLSWLNLDTEWGTQSQPGRKGADPAADQRLAVWRGAGDGERPLGAPARRGRRPSTRRGWAAT